MFSFEFCEIFKNTFFTEHLELTAFKEYDTSQHLVKNKTKQFVLTFFCDSFWFL